MGTATDIQRLAESVEKLTDLTNNDLRDIRTELRSLNRVGDKLSERLDDSLERLDRIEGQFRHFRIEHDTLLDIPSARERRQSGAIPIPAYHDNSGPIALEPRDQSGITADHDKIVLRWEFVGHVFSKLKWALLIGAGAGADRLLEFLANHLK